MKCLSLSISVHNQPFSGTKILANIRHINSQRLTVLPRRNAAPAPTEAPIESATKPTGSPKR